MVKAIPKRLRIALIMVESGVKIWQSNFAVYTQRPIYIVGLFIVHNLVIVTITTTNNTPEIITIFSSTINVKLITSKTGYCIMNLLQLRNRT